MIMFTCANNLHNLITNQNIKILSRSGYIGKHYCLFYHVKHLWQHINKLMWTKDDLGQIWLLGHTMITSSD